MKVFRDYLLHYIQNLIKDNELKWKLTMYKLYNAVLVSKFTLKIPWTNYVYTLK